MVLFATDKFSKKNYTKPKYAMKTCSFRASTANEKLKQDAQTLVARNHIISKLIKIFDWKCNREVQNRYSQCVQISSFFFFWTDWEITRQGALRPSLVGTGRAGPVRLFTDIDYMVKNKPFLFYKQYRKKTIVLISHMTVERSSRLWARSASIAIIEIFRTVAKCLQNIPGFVFSKSSLTIFSRNQRFT